MPPITDHPLRFKLANELHARPFPSLKAPAYAVYLAMKRDPLTEESKAADVAHLIALLDRYGVAHPPPDATHYSGQIGRYHLKWENHSEFVTYTVFVDGLGERAFDPVQFDVFPEDWLAAAPGVRATSALFHIDRMQTDAVMDQVFGEWFVPESLAVSSVLDGAAVIAGDYRIDEAGHMRFAVFLSPGTGARRTGRIVQRLCEIETYKSMSMLGFHEARSMSQPLGQTAIALERLTEEMSQSTSAPDDTLAELMPIAAKLENMISQTSYRFGATAAYAAIVAERVKVLREERYGARQTFAEFMMRRYDPAMRTVKATERQLRDMSNRALRAGELLRTRVDVERSAQNQQLLESMNHRADTQLRLQKTVEGLSVVAISYYAVSLASYMLDPVAEAVGVGKPILTAGLVPIVVLLVWWIVRQIRKSVH